MRPKVERKLAHLMRRKHGGRHARVRGRAKVDADFNLVRHLMCSCDRLCSHGTGYVVVRQIMRNRTQSVSRYSKRTSLGHAPLPSTPKRVAASCASNVLLGRLRKRNALPRSGSKSGVSCQCIVTSPAQKVTESDCST